MRVSPSRRLPIMGLAALTGAALIIHGYHLGAEDGEIHIPSMKKLLDPSLYPYASEFFTAHEHLSLFGPILAWTARLTHLSADWTIFAWYIATLFATLLSAWLVASACFQSEPAKWCSVLVLTAVLTMPATNTSLLLMDPYLTARSLSTPLCLFALAAFLERRYAWVGVALLVTGTIHPQMAVYLVFLVGVMWVLERVRSRVHEPVPVMAALTPLSFITGVLPTGFHLAPATGPYREALYSRDYYFLSNWSWYHWLGMLAPLAILAWFWKGKLRGTKPGFERLSFAMIPFGLLSIAVALVFSSSHDFDMFARLQPLRSFHLITLVFVLLLAGVIGEYWAKGRSWVLAAVSVPLAAGMFFVARDTYAQSPQIELPSRTSSNPWVNALLWVRQNTPDDAVFAVDSRYFKDEGTDLHGFRAVSERSALADYFKDGGVVSLFPDLAVEWKQMSNATYGLNHFNADDFRRLRQQYQMISWTVIHGLAPQGMDCPYQERGYAVCHLPGLSATRAGVG
jgi:hypothetical protein